MTHGCDCYIQERWTQQFRSVTTSVERIRRTSLRLHLPVSADVPSQDVIDRDDEEMRAAAFAWLNERCRRSGDVLDWGELKVGFPFRGRSIPLIVQQGINKPKELRAALSIATTLRPKHRKLSEKYDDHFVGEDMLGYRYQGKNAQAWDNRALRVAMDEGRPMIYLSQVMENPSRYAVVRPVYVVREKPEEHCFYLQHEPPENGSVVSTPGDAWISSDLAKLHRSYATRQVRQRLHQQAFRERVLGAYGSQCAMCRFKHRNLLDAAHIDPDSDVLGDPHVSNGLSLCRLHHGAFDTGLIGVRPGDLAMVVQVAVLAEKDGPVLRHALQELHGAKIHVPTRAADRPDAERLHRHLLRSGLAS